MLAVNRKLFMYRLGDVVNQPGFASRATTYVHLAKDFFREGLGKSGVCLLGTGNGSSDKL